MPPHPAKPLVCVLDLNARPSRSFSVSILCDLQVLKLRDVPSEKDGGVYSSVFLTDYSMALPTAGAG